MARVARGLALSLGGLLGLAVVVSAPGWLYVIQPRHAVPGPPLATALPA
jgi:hypothetical protein